MDIKNLNNRCILHSDMNGFYASVECLYNPAIRDKPMVVAGDVEARRGIVLAKNEIAKAFGIKTGSPLWQAKQLCPEVLFVPPNFERYTKFSSLAREIYAEYTDRVEPFGLDEAWLDISENTPIFGSGKTIADQIRNRIRFELGLTVSIGVSFNKVFAKLGSDMKKPDATTVITHEDFHQSVWKLPVGDLLYVGRVTKKKLNMYGIFTIGDLARTEKSIIQRNLGKTGDMLWNFANGFDFSPVAKIDSDIVVKSVGNSTTAPRDLVNEEDVKITLKSLSENVASRLGEQDFICRTVQLGIRSNELSWIERQAKLLKPSRTVEDIFNASYELFLQNHDFNTDLPVRSLSVKACDLDKSDFEQLTFS